MHAALRTTLLLVHCVLFFAVHSLVYIVDIVLFGTVLCLGRRLFRKPHGRRSRDEAVVDVHTNCAADAHAWFGWPMRLPRTSPRRGEGTPAVEAYAPRYKGPRFTNHISTILSNFKPTHSVNYRREIIQSDDGCDLCVDWAYPEDNRHLHEGLGARCRDVLHRFAKAVGCINNASSRFGVPPQKGWWHTKPGAKANHMGVLAVAPGLMSSSQTTYIRSFVAVALDHGFIVAIVHTRGIGTPLTRPKLFHGGFTTDVRSFTYKQLSHDAIVKRCGEPLPAVFLGFSLGGNMLANFLAEDGEKVTRESNVVCCASIASPWMFRDIMPIMAGRVQKMTYDMDFKYALIDYLNYNEKALTDPKTGEGKGFDWKLGTTVIDVPAFDRNVVVPHHGFGTVLNYYDTVSCFQRLHKIRVPTVCAATADDPICGPPPSTAKWAEVCASAPWVSYAELPAGGHLGCLAHPLQELCWAPNVLEALVCRSISHYVLHHAHRSRPTSPTKVDPAARGGDTPHDSR